MPSGYAWGYASGNFLKISNFLKFSPRRRLRLCPRANKNLHIPAGYSKTTPRALPQVLSKILKFAPLLQYSTQRR
ncbi:hypothetical protein T03_170, partial [Trichinella britovi]